MGMTITEKIMARASGKTVVTPGENVWLNVDTLMTHDVCGPPTIQIWKSEFGEKAKIWDKNKLVIFPDHYIFTANIHACVILQECLSGFYYLSSMYIVL